MERTPRICLAASAGGHASELLRLQECWRGRDCFFVTTSYVIESQLTGCGRVYVVEESNREHPLRVFIALVQCLKIALTERPTTVISTGAAVGCLMAILGKLLGAHVVWVDSIANTERLSLSGRLVRPLADLVLSQWPHVAQQHKDVECVGQIL